MFVALAKPRALARPDRCLRAAPLAVALLLAPGAWAQDATPLSFDAARTRLLEHSEQLAASRAGEQAAQLQTQALQHLGGPSVALTGMAYAYNANLGLDLDPLNQGLGQINAALPSWAQNLVGRVPVPQLPSSYTLNRHASGTHASVAAVWPIYTGGATDAARGLFAAREREAEADSRLTGQQQDSLLVQRYFGAQLARRAAELRAQAERATAGHDQAAARMLAEGVIARVERLQASTALDEARRNARKAESDAELAAAALARTVGFDGRVTPQTPLFVISQPIEPLLYFIDAALTRHPGIGKVAAKKAQAERLHEGEEALRRPQVVAFGSRQLKTGNADWAVGLGVRWTLYDSLDRDALEAASLKKVEQAERADAQLRSDLALLVERHWRAVDTARRQYLDMDGAVALAAEVLRLRATGLREGTSTTLELIDAETNQAKVLTERAQAANDYVQALAQLLEAAGLSEQFPAYIARADIRVPTLDAPAPK